MTGGNKKRNDLQQGQQQYNEFANKAIALQQPFAQAGVPAVNQLSSFSGLNGANAQATAENQFKGSLFYTGGENAFGTEKDNIDSTLSNQGLLYSQARLGAVEDARIRNYQNAFNSFLNNTGNVANVGIGAATNQGNVLQGQGNAAIGTQQNIANTRQGFLGGLQQVANIGAQVGAAATGFSDRRLKRDIEVVERIGPLTAYRWQWNDKAAPLGLSGEGFGFIADEVALVYPDAVSSANGYQTVNYGLVAEMLG